MLFGLLRYILANFVILKHIGPGHIGIYGLYAVSGFFILSGFLAAYSMHKHYDYSKRGIFRYYLNRIIRIFPVYWIILAISLLIIIIFPDISNLFKSSLFIPENILDWLKNIFIFGLSPILNGGLHEPMMVPTAWFLNTIILLYILSPFLCSNIKKAIIWFFLSLFINVYLLKFPFSIRYFSILGASLPYCLGVIIYYLSRKIKIKSIGLKIILLITLIFLNIIFGQSSLVSQTSYPYYINMLLLALLIIFLSKINRKIIISKLQKIDNLLGNLSFPIFLLHWQIAVIVVYFFYNSQIPGVYSNERLYLYLYTLIFVNIFGFIITKLINNFTNKLRNNIRINKI